ncbi:MAG: hypothetical protein AMJ78_00770 [Omnitrophica WOR_2 bacterium SM23_29]|nr:MAG: hypothetical protein AMJ78_00770 [Omnitrophica WOR_2 bacterium SM23_29]
MNPEIWPYYRGYYKVYTEDYEIVKKLSSWKDCRHSNTYYRNEKVIGWDMVFPSRFYNKVARLVGLPLGKKNPNRKRQGQIMADKNRQHKFKG